MLILGNYFTEKPCYLHDSKGVPFDFNDRIDIIIIFSLYYIFIKTQQNFASCMCQIIVGTFLICFFLSDIYTISVDFSSLTHLRKVVLEICNILAPFSTVILPCKYSSRIAKIDGGITFLALFVPHS